MIIKTIILSLGLFSVLIPGNNPGDILSDKETGQYYYRVYFTDKGNVSTEDFDPLAYLSSAAILRRQKSGITIFTYTDFPVNEDYVREIESLGLTFCLASKWMNTALFCSSDAFDTNKINSLPFVKKTVLVKHPVKSETIGKDKYEIPIQMKSFSGFDPIVPLNGEPLFNAGFRGRGVTIAVLDAGFENSDKNEALAHLYAKQKIISTYDFVDGEANVYSHSWHGTAVLSVMAASLPLLPQGPAQDASYILLRTEDPDSEYPVEEDYWIAGAEYADSAGADIISSSLGYSAFDDSAMNYTFNDADGNTAFVTRGADVAASKGILVVSSAGNERNKEWLRIIFPSDGDSVLCIGALSQNMSVTSFSSSGYSSDGRVKPDMVAPGENLAVQILPSQVHYVNGTSFSCPLISGLSAALWQTRPAADAAEIRNALIKSCSMQNNPDSLYGYGFPNAVAAYVTLANSHITGTVKETDCQPKNVVAGPNPFSDEIKLWFFDTPGYLAIDVTDFTGRVVIKREHENYLSRYYVIEGLSQLIPGIYYVRVTTSSVSTVIGMIKKE